MKKGIVNFSSLRGKRSLGNKMKKFMFFLIVLFLPHLSFAEDIYIAQTASGSDAGVDCLNAHSAAWFNTYGNWGDGDNKIGPGDTVHLCGTITSTLTPKNSGSVGNVITLLFENNAKLSAPFWASTGAISLSGVDYITINGGANGIIECTDNGTDFTNQENSVGMFLNSCNNLTINNLTISNIYKRTADSSDSNRASRSIEARNCSNLNVHNCNIHDAEYTLYILTSTSGTFNNFNIYNNIFSNMATGFVIALGTDGSNINNVNFYGNMITGGNVWDGEWTHWHHVDGIHTWTRSNMNDKITNMKIYNNTIGPDMGSHCTSWIYLSDMTDSPQIYNNLLYNNTEGPSSGFIHFLTNYSSPPAISAKIYNNTIIGGGATYAFQYQNVTGIEIVNNIVTDVIFGIAEGSTAVASTEISNYNCWYNLIGQGGDTFRREKVSMDYNEWKALGFDANSITSNPSLDLNYRPSSGSSPVVDAGKDLSTYFISDKDSILRPQGIAWDLGAYEFELKPSPPSNLRIVNP